LFSSFIGGRSGNRGKCAQPCRKKYSGCFYLSTKELNLSRKIPELIDLKIDSLKIEGRMRTPYYVNTTSSVYRKIIDDCYSGKFKINEEIQKKLESAFSREFTEGSYSSELVFNRTKAMGESNISEVDYEVPVKPVFYNRKKVEFKFPKILEKSASEKRYLVRVYNLSDGVSAFENGADILYFDLFDNDFF
jgi:collagenase-like PrtC family protease